MLDENALSRDISSDYPMDRVGFSASPHPENDRHNHGHVFYGVATDFDGVFSKHDKPEIATTMVPLLTSKSLGKGAPLAIITGKEFNDALLEIASPIRTAMANLGLKINPRQALIYANNGSVIYDIGLDETLEIKTFDFSTLEMLTNTRSIALLLELYEHIDSTRMDIQEQLAGTHFRQLDQSTICLRLNPLDLQHPAIDDNLRQRFVALTGKESPSRFEIAQAMQAEFALIGLADIQISSTDRSIDITPPKTGKRAALEHFAKLHGRKPEDFLRFGDSPTGMDYGLLAAFGNETRTGFSNVPINPAELTHLQNTATFQNTRGPRIIEGEGTQFEKITKFLDRAIIINSTQF